MGKRLETQVCLCRNTLCPCPSLVFLFTTGGFDFLRRNCNGMTSFTWWGKCHREFLGESSSIADPGQNAVDMFVTVFKSRITALFVWGKGKTMQSTDVQKLFDRSTTIYDIYMLLSIVLTLRTPSAAVPERYSCIHHGTCLRRSLEAFGGPVGNMRAYHSNGWELVSFTICWERLGFDWMTYDEDSAQLVLPADIHGIKHPREVFPKICRCQGHLPIELCRSRSTPGKTIATHVFAIWCFMILPFVVASIRRWLVKKESP